MSYQDYVIKDGQFVGQFEKMYQECDDPWMQSDEIGISYSRHDTILTVKRFGLKNVLEVGSGLGYFTSLLSQNCPDTLFTGMDISDTAVKKARMSYPQLTFVRGGCMI
jgi:tRNA G46 methylase TrmB